MIRQSIPVLLLGALMLSCSGGVMPEDGAASVRTVFVVEGMHCDGCSSAITEALEGSEGVESASANHESGIAEAVHRADNGTPEELKTAIEDLGYTVASWETAPISATGRQPPS